MENTLYDVMKAGTEGQDAAMRAAANSQIIEQNKLAMKVQQMNLANAQQQQQVQNFLGANWREVSGGQPAAPVAPQAPPPVAPMAAMQQLPPNQLVGGVGGDMPTGLTADPRLQPLPAPAAVAPQTAQPTPAASRYPSDEQLMQAIQSGRISPQVADGVRTERVQFEMAQKQAAIKEKLGLAQKLTEDFVKSGDNEGFQKFAAGLQADPDLAPYLPKLESVTIPQKGAIETVKKFTADEIKGIAEKFPKLGINPENTPEGTYKITMQNGQPTKWEPVKEQTQTAEQLRRDFTDPKLPKTKRDASFFNWLEGAAPQQIRTTAANKSLPPEYRQAAQDVLNAMAKEKADNTRISISLRGAGGEEGSDSFKSYTPEMKEQAFKDRNLGQYKYPTGMKSMAEKKAFDAAYYKWRVSGKIDAADVAAQKSDVGSDKFIAKQLDASKSFIGTIDNNIDQLEGHITQMSKSLNLDRNRLLNMGTRQFNKKLMGTANVNIYDMLVNAISTENAKLQSGGAGSVAQVAEGARVEMEKIHDKNMPVSEMLKLMKATRVEGSNRIKALESTRKDIRQRMSGGSKSGGISLDMNALDAAIARKLAGGK